MGGEVSLAHFCCAQEELLWLRVVAALTMGNTLVP